MHMEYMHITIVLWWFCSKDFLQLLRCLSVRVLSLKVDFGVADGPLRHADFREDAHGESGPLFNDRCIAQVLQMGLFKSVLKPCGSCMQVLKNLRPPFKNKDHQGP